MGKLQKMKFFDSPKKSKISGNSENNVFRVFRKNLQFFQKAQAAMEFLITYGWAILVVIVVIAIITYSGFIGGAFFLPEKCVISSGSGLFCEDFSAYPGRIILRIKNLLQDPIEITAASISYKGNSCHLTSVEPPGTIEADSSSDLLLTTGITCLDLTLPGEKLKGDISITFTRKSFTKIAKGDTVFKIAESAAGAVDYNICYNANNSCICCALDVVFGPGYEKACCDIHDLCCIPCCPD